AAVLGPLQLNAAGVRGHDALRVAQPDAGGVAIAGVEYGLDGCTAARAQVFREIVGDDDGPGAGALVNLLHDVPVIGRQMHDVEIVGRLEAFQQVLAVLRAVAIVDAQRHVLHVQIHGVTVNEQQNQRDRKNDEQAAHVARDLDELLPHHRSDAPQAHGRAPSFAPREVVSATNTSSSVGGMLSTRLTTTFLETSASRIGPAAARASATTACSALPNTAASSTPGAERSASSPGPSGSHSTSSSSPFIEPRFNSVGVPMATIRPRSISTSWLQYSASSM